MGRRLTICVLGLLIGTLYVAESHDHSEDFSDSTSEYVYKSPTPAGFAYFSEHFDDHDKFEQIWIRSQAKKNNIDDEIAKYDGVWNVEQPAKNAESGDYGLVLKSKARHAAIAAPLTRPFHFKDKPLVVQYEVSFQEGQECGGAYLKLLTLDPAHKDLKLFHDQTPYTIMFGPDKCGGDHKLHFIFRHKNPLNGSIEEKHCKKPKDRLEDAIKDKKSHLYTLIVRPDNNFEIKLDNTVINDGNLLDDFVPPVNPPLEIEDPEDKRPEDWDDREKIPDPLAIKPEDWDEDAPAHIIDEEAKIPDGWLEDEPEMIPDPSAIKPDDWDTEMDGDWEPPMLSNPLCAKAPGCGPWKQPLKPNPRYKGKWLPPLINNPNYKGKWMPRLIHNPNYFNDENPFRMASIFAVGFELWSMSPDILFDNIIITDSEEVAKKWADDTFEVRQARLARESETFWGRLMQSMNHKPGWWAIYFVYCIIPVILYVSYLIKTCREWSSWNQLVEFTVKNPWIWAVYVLIAGLPLILLVYCCCIPSQEKHDAKSEDREPLEPNKEDLETKEDGNLESNEAAKSTVSEEQESEEEIEDQEIDTSEGKDDNADSEKDSTENVKDKPSAGGDGPRRRKPNKE